MGYPIAEIEGIGTTFAEKLSAAGVRTTDDLLEKAGSRSGRASLAEATGIEGKRILSWVNLADLMRVKGIGKQFSELLHAAGIDSIKELRTRNPANLATAVKEANERRQVSRTVPAESQIAEMIENAKAMEPAVSH